MTRIAVAFAVVLILGPVFASEPGQPLDCSDWVFLEPGYACSHFSDPSQQCRFSNGVFAPCAMGDISFFDNQGRIFYKDPMPVIGQCGSAVLYRRVLNWLGGDSWHTLAYFDERCVDPLTEVDPVSLDTDLWRIRSSRRLRS